MSATTTTSEGDTPTTASEPRTCAEQISEGQTIECSIARPTQVRTHAFAGRQGQHVRVTVSKLDGDFIPTYEIHGPDGTRLCGTPGAPALDCRLRVSGPHSITVEAYINHGTGRYSLSLTRLDTAPG